MQKITNSTDLHIQFKLDTGDSHHFYTDINGSSFHSEDSYTWEYTQWLEEKHLEELKKVYTEINDLEDEIEDLVERRSEENN